MGLNGEKLGSIEDQEKTSIPQRKERTVLNTRILFHYRHIIHKIENERKSSFNLKMIVAFASAFFLFPFFKFGFPFGGGRQDLRWIRVVASASI